MKVSARVRVSGPLTGFKAGFAAELAKQGYADCSIANRLRIAARFSRWLDGRHIKLHELTPELVNRYIAVRLPARTRGASHRALMPLLEHAGLIEVVDRSDPTSSEVLARYHAYLVDVRGLRTSTCAVYETLAAEFLDGREPEALTRADVLSLVRRRANRPGLAGKLTPLRSFLRFLHVTGETTIPLVSVVPSMAQWRQASLPKALESAQVRAVLASCDRRTTVGRRDYAVILLMLRLGLRACEVAALTLDHVDWVEGEIVVHGKGGGVSRLPLPVDVGEALIAWIRRRRRHAPTRALFLYVRAPYSPASVSTIRKIAGLAMRRAGVPVGGGHRLRHTAATLMLRRGASLTEIAHVLRHRHIDTTAIYAKVDRDGLRRLARPWPTGYAGGAA